MGRGSYHGGGTVIGFGRLWSDWGDFPTKEQPARRRKLRAVKRNNKGGQEKEILLVRNGGAVPVSRNLLKAHERSKHLPITKAELLKKMGVSRKALTGKHRGAILKSLLDKGVLLPTGLPNPDSPQVLSIIRKKKNFK
ncbi:hypothetical protein ACFO8O_14330 [Hephaestia sp. GCM10023244]|uniref:hypothetical protein n=1 Tax=unclassified Hephaestia TaxID=2631281 RepID=UPI002076FA2F|nr:hypothetical protein [Hephaestia sp. MAHUQ-44]MCM8732139.1 hypothetical protein [Hephaestia sp. MAHUQ-44]